MLETTLLPAHPLVESVLGSFRQQLGRDFAAYRGYVYRVFHHCRALVGGEAHQAIAVAAVFHDIGIWADNTFDSLEPSRARARAFLAVQTHRTRRRSPLGRIHAGFCFSPNLLLQGEAGASPHAPRCRAPQNVPPPPAR